jgi:photosystem II stability/assembly factor-like uncharacterized protein
MDDRLTVTMSATTAALLLAFNGACNATPAPNTWHETAALPMTWFQDMSFVSARVGFAAGGNGQVLRTTDGGVTWTDSAATTHVFERDFDHIRVGGFDADDTP